VDQFEINVKRAGKMPALQRTRLESKAPAGGQRYEGPGNATVHGWRAVAVGECGHGMPCPYCGKGKGEKNEAAM
jgi:hypothetical protein